MCGLHRAMVLLDSAPEHPSMDNRQEKGFTAFAAPVSSVPLADSGGGLPGPTPKKVARRCGLFF